MTDTEQRTIAGLPVLTVAERVEYLKLLVYGDSGVGKTTLAGSAYDVPEMRPVLFVDMEGGTKSIRNRYPEIEVIRVREEYTEKGRLVKTAWSRLVEVYEALKIEQRYRTVVIDSLSEAYEVAMKDIMTGVVQEYPDRDPDVPGQREYGRARSQLRRMTRRFRDLPINVIFTALKGEKTTDDGRVVAIGPALSGKLMNEIPAFMDEVYHLYVKDDKEDVKRFILTRKTGKNIAKTRSDLPMTVENPSMPAIADIVIDKKG